MKKTVYIGSFVVILGLLLSACGAASTLGNIGALSNAQAQTGTATPAPAASTPAATASASSSPTTSANTSAPVPGNALLDAYQGTLEQIYSTVIPSVVEIQVTSNVTSTSNGFGFGNPQTQVQQALGTGFIWDKQGDIVTNNHVVNGATSIEVVFSDGLTVPAKIVGQDLNNDLAVIKVNVPTDRLKPVTMGDSSTLKIGQLAIAIGSPYGEQGSMTVGIISGLDRTLPVNINSTNPNAPQYVIPDIIQTDAPINPGNSGGVLLNDQGQVVGVTAAIESNTNSNSGVGFVIPATIVKKVVPSLISTGSYQEPWLGIGGTDVVPQIATAMNLNSDQRGVLVEQVTSGSPAVAAGIQAGSQTIDVNGTQLVVGGDIIVSVNGQAVKSFNDLITYLASNTSVGQKITLGILRNGKPTTVDVTLAARPSSSSTSTSTVSPTPGLASQGGYMGINGVTLDAAIAQAMNLPSTQQGVLVQQVQSGSPAANAGIQGGSQTETIGGSSITIGGDIIVGFDGQPVTSIQDLQGDLQQSQGGQRVLITILRNGRQSTVRVTLGSIPTSVQ